MFEISHVFRKESDLHNQFLHELDLNCITTQIYLKIISVMYHLTLI